MKVPHYQFSADLDSDERGKKKRATELAVQVVKGNMQRVERGIETIGEYPNSEHPLTPYIDIQRARNAINVFPRDSELRGAYESAWDAQRIAAVRRFVPTALEWLARGQVYPSVEHGAEYMHLILRDLPAVLADEFRVELRRVLRDLGREDLA